MHHPSLARQAAAALLTIAFWLAGANSLAATMKPDSGRFVLTIQGTQVGTDSFRCTADGSSESDQAINLGGQAIKIHCSIKARAGQVTQITTVAHPGGKLSLSISGTHGTVKLEGGSKILVKSLSLPGKVYPFGNFGPHHLNNLLAAYDTGRGGSQAFTLILVESGPGVTLHSTLTATGAKNYTVAGRRVPVLRYALRLTTPVGPLEMDLLADTNNHLLMWDVPAQRYQAIRDGFQDLAKNATAEAPLLSKATYPVKTDADVMIPMRDGVKLAADIYRPDAPGPFPVILQRTPYDRHNAFEAAYYARRGYVFVAQDVRGKFGSQGRWEPFVNEAHDGYDTIEWCARQPWSTGNVGMIGASYLGYVQWAAAREGPPHLKCLIPIVSPPDPCFNIPYSFGAFFLYPTAWWSEITDGRRMNAIPTLKSIKPLLTLPLRDIDRKLFGHSLTFFQTALKHPPGDPYWQPALFDAQLKRIGPLPVLHVSGWFDGDGIGTRLNYAAMVDSGHANQKLVYGPWPHLVNFGTKLGELDFGPDAIRDLDTLYLRWFDRWLKGIQNGVDREPPVDAFLMGVNQWRSFSAWPPKRATMERWYLGSQGHANGSRGDGVLSLALSAHEPADHYTYDPSKLFGLREAEKALSNVDHPLTLNVAGLEKDPNRLIYSSAVLKQPVAVAGPISLHLVAATSARDTDWTASLTDVYPDGTSIQLCTGIIRARYRQAFNSDVLTSAPVKATLLKPGQIVDYTLDLWALGHVFRAGHRIRLHVSSSAFPLYDRNLNTGGNIATGTRMVVAHQTVYHDAAHPSYLMLPVLPGVSEGRTAPHGA